MSIKETTEWWWDEIAPICAVVGIVWWFGPINVATFVLAAIFIVLVVGVPVMAIVWAATGGR